MRFTLAVKDLKAVGLFASIDVWRNVLRGVLVEYSPERVRLVATDGYTMGVIERFTLESDITESGKLVIPSSAIKRALFGWARKEKRISLSSSEIQDEFRLGDVVFIRADANAKYPEHRKVVISKPSGEPGEYNPVLMARFSAAAKILGAYLIPQFGQNGPENAAVALMHGDDGFYGLLSPIRMNCPFPSIPDWVLADRPSGAEIPPDTQGGE